MELITKYFPHLPSQQMDQLSQLGELYTDWNAKVNLISRKDMEHFYERHVLHSLAIAKLVKFQDGSRILDVGTGGGFPGIPLAIVFPACNFTLVDSIGKKVKVVEAVAHTLGLKNLAAKHSRVEQLKQQFDYIVSRAVTNMPRFVELTYAQLARKGKLKKDSGIWYLKGGDLSEELENFPSAQVYALKALFKEEFFETKMLVHLGVDA